MTTAKTFYTYAELSKMNTQRLISTYNRIFNTNAFELFFNPYESRIDMLLELMDEMRLQKALSLLPQMTGSVEKYQSLKIVVSADGFAILWNVGVKVTNRNVTDEQMTLIRELREDGETYKSISQYTGVSQTVVFDVLKGRYAVELNRWNASTNAPQEMKKRPVAKATFKAANRKANYETLAEAVRPMNSYWQELGL